MRSPKLTARQTWLTALLIVVCAAGALTLLAWRRLQYQEKDAIRRAELLPAETESAKKLLALRATIGDETKVRPRRGLIPFLETAASQSGIRKEALAISSDTPKPVQGRPDLVEQETRVDLSGVEGQSLDRFLSMIEKDFPMLVVRDLGLNQMGRGRGWSAHLRLIARLPLRESPEPEAK